MYIMGREARRLILDYARLLSTPIMFEDILYTGIIAKKAGIRRVHWKASVSLDFRTLPFEIAMFGCGNF
ncbi:unnamed protein product [Cylicostephanus goldi]|uniref:Uncharacterized protein n=1 Tax=Cylicostephanus goldi TaxID=71465 RepID=A0A3P6T567_CYLGO|nr:unnamed protein product [Cylicostephanus goldi]